MGLFVKCPHISTMPGHAYCAGLALPRRQCCPVFFFFLSGIFLIRQRGRAAGGPTCIQPWLAPSWLSHCFIQGEKKKLQGTHQKPLKCDQPSAENCITLLSWLENLCHRISWRFQLQELDKNEDILPASSHPAQTPFPAHPAASLSKYRDLNCNECSQPFHQERLNLLSAKNNKS